MDAGKRLINDLFNGNRTIFIPFFQRSYVWKEEQWERFLADMEMVSEEKRTYFLGSVILKQMQNNGSGNGDGDIRTLIDGQQRFTTLNIFFKVLYLKLNRNESFDRLFRLDNATKSLALQHNYNDIRAFEKVLSFTEEQELDASANNIFAVYEYFRKNIELDKIDEQAIKNNIMFVGIDLGDSDDEQQIFDTINSLSVRLTTAELLKNFFFDRKEDVGKFQKYWQSVFEGESQTRFWDYEFTVINASRAIIDIFFYSYLQIKIQDPNLKISSADKTAFSRMGSVFNSYKKLIEIYKLDKTIIFEEIHEYASLFRQNFDFTNAQVIPQENDIRRLNTIIFGLKSSTLIPYVMYILKHVTDIQQRNELFGAIEAYMMRRMITRSSTSHYNALFFRMIANKILSRSQFIAYLQAQDDSVNAIPSDEDVKHAIHHHALTNLQAKGILYLLESKIRHENYQATQLLSFQKYSLEHLMPKKWQKNWVLSHYTAEQRDKKIPTLGNLTIIPQSLNNSISNADWTNKKTGNKRSSGLIQYATGLETLTPYLSFADWNEDAITKRADDLYRYFVNIWSLK